MADIGICIYGEGVQDESARRDAISKGFQDQVAQMNAAQSEVTRLRHRLDWASPDYPSNLQSLQSVIVADKAHIETTKAVAEQIVTEKLYVSDEDHDQMMALVRGYSLRGEQSDLLAQEIDEAIALNAEGTANHKAIELAAMNGLESDI